MDSVEADGGSIDEAIASALKMLGATRERVEIEILSNAARGFLGIGGRKARVRATLRSPIDAEPAPAAAKPATPAPQTEAPRALRPQALDHHAAERGREVLQAIIDHIGVTAGVAVREEDDHILLDLTGDSTGVLIGRRGQMLDALEYIVNRIVSRDEGGSMRIVVDSQSYRQRRREALEELARRMGEQARKKRRAVTLNPMSPRDRRIVHLVLQGDPSLSTKSSGKGYFRKIVILPAEAGERRRGDGED
jgi:spoIIIJ-associated protein